MNFNCYLPGKMLGSNLMIGNLTDFDQIIELSVDSNSYKYNVSDTISRYPECKEVSDSMPFDIRQSGKEWIVNSEMKHESWFIENPVSKELTKRITLKLGPKSQQDFVIVVKSPTPKKTENMLTLINVGLLTYKGEEFSAENTFEDFLAHKYDGGMKAFLADRKRLAQEQRSRILLAGRVEVPKLTCQREMELDNGLKVLPLAVKKGIQIPQKFRIPFKNLS
mgnify:CR=1 FL=1